MSEAPKLEWPLRPCGRACLECTRIIVWLARCHHHALGHESIAACAQHPSRTCARGMLPNPLNVSWPLRWPSQRTPLCHASAVLLHHTPSCVRARYPSQVCGLKWAPGGYQLASGGNDNLLNIWDERRLPQHRPLFRMTQHKAAVKALAWCPWQKHLLASGGGTADRTIRFWSTQTGQLINTVDTHSQVCALLWSVHDHELVSSHGYSHNQLILWKYPSMVKVSELTGHTARVLHMAPSPDGTTVVSAAADETLRFWRILGSDRSCRSSKPSSMLSTSAWTGANVVR